eukprot:s1963_g18.t1
MSARSLHHPRHTGLSKGLSGLAFGCPQQLLRSRAGCHPEREVRRTMATTRYADVESQLQGVSEQQDRRDCDFPSGVASEVEGTVPANLTVLNVRLGFVRKVYGIVCAQVMFTAMFGALCCWGPLNAPVLRLATSSPRLLQWGTLIASLVALAMCQLGKDRYPINMIGLCFLTAVMSLDVGVVCAMVAAIGLGELVVQAAVITSLLTLGLTLYTFKSKRDFSFLGAALWPLLFGLVVFSLLGVRGLERSCVSCNMTCCVVWSVLVLDFVEGAAGSLASLRCSFHRCTSGLCQAVIEVSQLGESVTIVEARQMGWTGLLFSFAGRAAPCPPGIVSALLVCVTAAEGAGIFCAFIVFDTWRILNQMNCDDYVQEIASGAALNCHTVQSFLHDSGQRQWTKGAIQLYLDIVNLFLYILEIMVQPTMHPSQLEEDVRLQNRSPSITSTSWHFEAAPAPTCDAVRRVDIQTTAAGPVPRMPPRSGAGRMSPPKASKAKDAPREAKNDPPAKTAKDAATEVTPGALMAEPGFMPEVCPRSHGLGYEDCPLLAGVFDYLAAGRVELAMQCIFSLGNEQTLRAVLQRLDPDAVWPELPKPEAQHLARLLVALLCRDPFSSAASEACPWLEALLRRPHGENLLPAEELLSLQGALFSASAVGGDMGPCAARLYFRLFQRQAQASASCPQLMFSSSRASALPVTLPQSCPCLWIGNGGGREDLRFVEDGGFDGAYTYFAAEGFTPGSNTKSWKDTAARLNKLGKLFVPSVGPGYDDTRVRPWNSHNIRERKGGEYYNRMWSAAVGSDLTKNAKLKSMGTAAHVTSYNEWGEGTQIEPAKRHRSWKGAKYGSYEPKPSTFYLTETKRWSDQFKAVRMD